MSEENSQNTWVDVFAEIEPDCTTQTGADWYRLALSASYGGKIIHGLDSTPSCEMLSKQTEAYAEKHATGRIVFDPTERSIEALGPAVTERPYTYKDYKGVRSSTGSLFALDQGMWEPSKKKRAREAALLAASIAATTGDQAGARRIVNKITSDVIDEEAVEVATIAVSHLRRDIVSVSKPSDRVFSCGTIQRGILWKDEQLLSEKFPAVADIDWGRITTVARYIAEANSQVDLSFRAYAYAHGVPYGIVRGSWAQVYHGDYLLDEADFSNIPTIDLTKYGIPSLADAYNNSTDNLLKLCYRNLNKLAYENESPDVDKLLGIIEECKFRVSGTGAKRPRWTETEVLADPSHHNIDEQAAARLTASAGAAFNALIDATTVCIRQDQEALRLAQRAVAANHAGQDDGQALDMLTKRVLVTSTWILATTYLSDVIGNVAQAERRMAKLKSDAFGFSGALAERMTITATMAKTARQTMRSVSKRALVGSVPTLPTVNLYTTTRAMVGAPKIHQAASMVIAHFQTFRKGWVERYGKWAALFKAEEGPNMLRDYVKYKTGTMAFKKLTEKNAMAISTRFIDPENPGESYLYTCAKKLAKKRKIATPVLPSLVYATAKDLAVDLDRIMSPEIAFVEAEEFAYSKLVMFAKDFGATEDDDIKAAEEASVQAKLAPQVCKT